jgi:beta-glucanase (GH16 family)
MFNHHPFFKPTLIFSFLLALCISCSGGGEDVPNIPPVQQDIIPTNLNLTISIVGSDANNPNGDGSGIIECTASATNAVKYGYRFGNGSEIETTTGNMEYTYTTSGTNTYTVYVVAYSSTGNSITTSKDVTIYVTPNTFDTLIFSDEFNVDGSPNSSNWNYDIGNGSNGWGNNEAEYYTDRVDNVIVENGLLKITAKKESYLGFDYTSTRMLTQNKFDFKYGRVEVKAKLPVGGGTWPAIWMLGSNITTVGWPACGEVDIMEHVGNDLGTIHQSIHTPSSFGATVNTNTTYVVDATTAFHIYAIEWTSDKIDFFIDGTLYYTYKPSTKNSNTWPFDANQFIILNVAMGGNFGGNIDPNFVQSTMEIDYVRVYQ